MAADRGKTRLPTRPSLLIAGELLLRHRNDELHDGRVGLHAVELHGARQGLRNPRRQLSARFVLVLHASILACTAMASEPVAMPTLPFHPEQDRMPTDWTGGVMERGAIFTSDDGTTKVEGTATDEHLAHPGRVVFVAERSSSLTTWDQAPSACSSIGMTRHRRRRGG